jgi:hypothetical protein
MLKHDIQQLHVLRQVACCIVLPVVQRQSRFNSAEYFLMQQGMSATDGLSVHVRNRTAEAPGQHPKALDPLPTASHVIQPSRLSLGTR